MANGDLPTLRSRLEQNPAARARFLADLLQTLQKNGVDVDNSKVLDSLKLDLDLSDGKKFVGGLSASSVIITITA